MGRRTGPQYIQIPKRGKCIIVEIELRIANEVKLFATFSEIAYFGTVDAIVLLTPSDNNGLL